jgi:hypothetical protein
MPRPPPRVTTGVLVALIWRPLSLGRRRVASQRGHREDDQEPSPDASTATMTVVVNRHPVRVIKKSEAGTQAQ